MDTYILIFLSSLGIIWAQDPISVLPPVPRFKSPDLALNPIVKNDILDLFKRSGSDSVPPSPVDGNLDFLNLRIGPENKKPTFSEANKCEDSNPLCPENKKYCYDEHIMKICQQTCGVCSKVKPENKCEDGHPRCSEYKKKCNEKNIMKICQQTCGVCNKDVPIKFHGPYNRFFECDQIGLSRLSKTLDECADLCARESQCTAFNHGTKNQRCELEDCGSPPQPPTGVHEGYESWSKDKLQRHKLPLQVESIRKDGYFSLFKKDHKQALLSLISHFKTVYELQPNTTIQYLKEVKPHINVYLYQAALSSFFTNKGLRDFVPPVSERYPEDFVSVDCLQMIKEESKNITVGRNKRQVVTQDTVTVRRLSSGGWSVNQRLDLSGTDHIREHRVAYFREDYGMNSHHENWHREMNEDVDVPRKGEYFIYMHAQMLKRYNAERLAVDLPPVKEYSNFYRPIEVGHLSNLGYTINSFGIRDDNMIPRDYGPNDVYRQWQNKGEIENQIQDRDVNDVKFMGELEDYHDEGHSNIAVTVRRERFQRVSRNVMAFSTTSARDNVFYRWHQHIDDLYEEYMKMKRRVTRKDLTRTEMAFGDIELKSVSVESNKRSNELLTGCGYHRLDITNGLDFATRGVFIEMTHLDHVPFVYHIQYNNKASVERSGVVRIFLAPTNDERGNRMDIEKQRKYWVEMDKFKYNFKRGNNHLERKSSESTVTVDCRKGFVGCKFPFIFHGVSYTKCSNPDKSDRPWCSTKTDDKNNHISGNWKYCDGFDECQFPWIFDGKSYDTCANPDNAERGNWCSTRTDDRNRHIRGHFKYCNDDPFDRDGHCGCGWPQHLLIPRGTPNGMKFNIFVIVTNEDNILDWNVIDSSHSTLCRPEGQVSSDRREMGFPFHAAAPWFIKSIRNFPEYLANSAVADITIRFHGNAVDPNEDPVVGCAHA